MRADLHLIYFKRFLWIALVYIYVCGVCVCARVCGNSKKRPFLRPSFFGHRAYVVSIKSLHTHTHYLPMNSHKSKFDIHPTFPHHWIEIIINDASKPLNFRSIDQKVCMILRTSSHRASVRNIGGAHLAINPNCAQTGTTL